jgi:DNA-binding IclR family transcriptional regulator
MPERDWQFLTSHTIVLLQLAETPERTVREIAEHAELTERQTHRVLADLVDEGYVARARSGRRNVYRIEQTKPLRHPSVRSRNVGELLAVLRSR